MKTKKFELGADVEKALIELCTLDDPKRREEMLEAWRKRHGMEPPCQDRSTASA